MIVKLLSRATLIASAAAETFVKNLGLITFSTYFRTPRRKISLAGLHPNFACGIFTNLGTKGQTLAWPKKGQQNSSNGLPAGWGDVSGVATSKAFVWLM